HLPEPPRERRVRLEGRGARGRGLRIGPDLVPVLPEEDAAGRGPSVDRKGARRRRGGVANAYVRACVRACVRAYPRGDWARKPFIKRLEKVGTLDGCRSSRRVLAGTETVAGYSCRSLVSSRDARNCSDASANLSMRTLG